MRTSKKKQNQNVKYSLSALILFAAFSTLTSFSISTINTNELDLNGDGTINILVLGTNSSLNGAEAFSPNQITEELQNILSSDNAISINVNVVAENIHMSQPVTVGLGGSGTEYTWTHHSHSLTQYYYWPDGLDARMANLSGTGDTDWDYVVIGADPHIISTTPGYYSLGVNKIAAKVAEGDAQPLLLMMWPKDDSSVATIEHFEEFTYRTADGAKVPVSTIPAGLAWEALPEALKDEASFHPSPNGAYLAAASIYSHLCGNNASLSEYTYDDEIADVALTMVNEAESQIHYTGPRTFISPFKSCDIEDDILNFNHTGSSSENGIKAGLEWVFEQTPETLQNGGESPIDFNYGRANSNFEPNKRYNIDPILFDFSFGFPMQDHGNNGDVSLLYGLDRRQSGTMNDVDLGVARFMIEEEELPYARAIPVRTLFAQMKEISPNISAYRDAWHMHRDLDKAIAAFMYTTLTSKCSLGEEPAEQDSDDWRKWMAHKIGYETAWTLMYLNGSPPPCSQFVDLDEDGFLAYEDCDDDNAEVNPDQIEETYNGIDDDCNPQTLDDDLDQDGFVASDDCDDNNANVNPNAEDIPNNGIDEDCDGVDMVSSVYKLANSTISIYPNPVVDLINIEVSDDLKYKVELYNLEGKLNISATNQNKIDVHNLPQGIYLLEIEHLNSGEKIVTKVIKGN